VPEHDARFELRLPQELLDRIDEDRGDIPKAVWLRWAIESFLNLRMNGKEQR
jgi:hypothetical protein